MNKTMTLAAGDDALTATVDGVRTQPRWFGPPEQPLFAVTHRPASGTVRGAVVLCPPIASELNFSYLLLRTLAVRLAAQGLLTVRFDYAGTGQSAGAINAPGRAQAYVDSIREAVELARGDGVGWIAGAGLRLGATLLAIAVDDGLELDALALWDPCLSGRGFLREQRTLLAASGAPVGDADDGTQIAGYLYTPETTAELGAIELPARLSGLHGQAVVVLDAARPGGDRIRRRLAHATTQCSEYDLDGPLLDTGLRAYELPERALEPVFSWLDGHAPVGDRAVDVGAANAAAGARRGCAVVGHAADGTPVEERMLRLGSGRLFAIETRGAVSVDRPVVVFLSIAAEPSIGPGRLWVDRARELAQQGYRCVRVDLSGVGESPPRPGEPVRVIYSPTVLEDVREVCAATASGPGVGPVLVGVCSGAYAILATAPQVPVSGAVAINPYLTLRAFEHWWSPDAVDAGRDAVLAPAPRRQRRVSSGLRAGVARLSSLGRNRDWREGLLDRFPTVAWTVLAKVGLAFSPATLINPILDAGVPLLLISGDQEGRQAITRAPGAFRRLGEAAHSHFAFFPDIDHSLRVIDSRRVAIAAIDEFLAALPGSPSRPSTSAAQSAEVPHQRSESTLLKAGVPG